MCCLNTQQCPLPRWKVATSGCAPLGKLWEVSTECLGQTSRLRSCWGRARWPQSRATVTVLPWAMGSCGHLSTCAYPCLWQRAALIGEKTTRAGKRAGMPTEVSREKHPGQSRKTVLIGPWLSVPAQWPWVHSPDSPEPYSLHLRQEALQAPMATFWHIHTPRSPLRPFPLHWPHLICWFSHSYVAQNHSDIPIQLPLKRQEFGFFQTGSSYSRKVQCCLPSGNFTCPGDSLASTNALFPYSLA